MGFSDLFNMEIAGPFAFISIFHVIGGVALGITLRGWASDPTRENLGGRVFFLVWGSMFGCMPLVFGLQTGLSMLAAQLAVLLVAIAVPFFWLERLRELTSDQNVVMIGFGGIFLIAGLAAGGFLLREGEWLFAALFGGTFTLLGGGFFLGGLLKLLRGVSEDE